MVEEVRIYFEGDPALREGFREFFRELEKAIGVPLQLIAGKARSIQAFLLALEGHPSALNVLLIDSEQPDDGKLFQTICRPQGIGHQSKETVFWMVQCMESWFLADVAALKTYYAQGFNEKALAGNPKVEEISKADVLDRLKRASEGTTKGRYHKTKHAPQILKLIQAEHVRSAAPNCNRLFESVVRLSPRE
jgi:hypothetical protein